MSPNSERAMPSPVPVQAPLRTTTLRRRITALAALLAVVTLLVTVTDVAAATAPARTLLDQWRAGSGVTVYQESSSRLAYGGRWATVSHEGYLGDRARATRAAGAKVTLEFTGSGIAWVGPVGPTRGKARVYIDGAYVATVDSRASAFSPARVLFKRTWSTSRTRRITVVALGTPGRPTIAVDAFLVRRAAYAAVFNGDATGRTDVTSSLRSFLQAHDGQRVALATNGVYKVTSLAFTATNLTVDFRGARLVASQIGVHGILRIVSSRNVTLIGPRVHGTGYQYADSTQWEHGIHVDGGSGITLNSPTTRDTRGDGIFTGYQPGRNTPPTGVLITNPDVQRAGRSGIAPSGGQVTIRGGRIADVGLHGVNMEPNDGVEASSIDVVVDGTDIRRVGDLAVGYPGWSVSAGWGHLGTMKQSVVVRDVTGDRLRFVVMNSVVARVVDNVSDASGMCEIIGSTSVTFSGNIRITRR